MSPWLQIPNGMEELFSVKMIVAPCCDLGKKLTTSAFVPQRGDAI